MDLEMVFNELSLRQLAPDIPTARHWMSLFIATLVQATSMKVKGILRTQSEFGSTLLALDYPVNRWRNDSIVDIEARRFYRTLETKSPYLSGLPLLEDKTLLCEYRHQDGVAEGLGVAYEMEALAISLCSETCWEQSRLSLEISQLDAEGNLYSETAGVVHACHDVHLQVHKQWIQTRIKRKGLPQVRDGSELWNRRQDLFPHLSFCEEVGKQLQQLLPGDIMLQPTVRRLSELEDYCQHWTTGPFDATQLSRATPESEATLQQYAQTRTFRCPDGIERVFSWHLRMTPKAWRLHFAPQAEAHTLFIGYIGKHLPMSTG